MRWRLEVSFCTLSLMLFGRLFPTPFSGVPYEPPAFTVESAVPRLISKNLTFMMIPFRFRSLYRLHLSTHSPITIIMKPWLWGKRHRMSFRSVSSTRDGDGGLDQVGLEYYKEVRFRWICAPHVVLVSRPRLAGAAGYLRLFLAHAVSTATFFIWG